MHPPSPRGHSWRHIKYRCPKRATRSSHDLPFSLPNLPRLGFAPPPAKARNRRIAAMGCQARQSAHCWARTHFRKRSQLSETGCQTRRCSRQLPACFGRIAYKSNPTHRVSPSCPSNRAGANRTRTARGSPFRLKLLRNVAPLSQQSG